MHYLICSNCDIYYEIEENFDLDSLNNCEKCGAKLKKYKSLDEYYNENRGLKEKVCLLVKVMLKK